MRWNKRNFGILKVCREKKHGRKKRGTRMEKLQKTITELNDKLKKKLETLRNGLSLKIGRFLTFVPRKIIDFTRK